MAFPLLSRNVVVEKLVFEAPEATVNLKPKSPAPEGDTESAPTAAEPGEVVSPLPVAISIEKLIIENGRITLNGPLSGPSRKVEHVFSDVNLRASNIVPGEKIEFRLSLRDTSTPGLGTLETNGSFSGLTESLTVKNPKLNLSATVSAMAVDAVKPFLTPAPLIQHIGGTVSIDVTYDGDFGKQFRSEGMLDLGKFTYTDPSLPERVLQGTDTKLRYKVSITPQAVTIEKFDLTSGDLAIGAKTAVDIQGDKPVIRKPVLTASLPLVELEPWIPWEKTGKEMDWVRDVLKKGGHVTIEKAVLPDIDVTELSGNTRQFLSAMKIDARVSGISGQPTPRIPIIKDVDGKVQLEGGAVHVDDLSGRIGPAVLSGAQATIHGVWDKPILEARVTGPLKMADPPDEISKKLLADVGLKDVEGTAELDLSLRLAFAEPEQFQLKGKFGLRNVSVATRLFPATFKALNAAAEISPEALVVSSLSADVTTPDDKNAPGGKFKVTVRNFKTSPIPVSSLSAVVPWDKIGTDADRIKETLAAGGTFSIEKFTISNIDLKKPPKDAASLFAGIQAGIRLDNVSVRPHLRLPMVEGIKGRVDIDKGALSAKTFD